MLLQIEDLTVKFGGLVALNRFSMGVREGEIHALIGPNGAGKSTIFNCISRFYTPVGGSIRFAGQDLLKLPAHRVAAAGIARTFQNVELCRRLTVVENVLVGMCSRIDRYFAFGPTRKRLAAERQAIREADGLIERLGLSAYRNVQAGHLDFGRQKMVDLARALAAKPTLLLLDEPAAGLRNREISALNDLLGVLINQHGITIVLVEHVMKLVMAAADSVSVLNFGNKISEGSPEWVRRDPQVIEAYLGQSVDA